MATANSAANGANPAPLQLQYRRCTDLQPAARNPRTHSAAQIRQIAASIREFGFTNPLLIDDRNQVIAGHGRLLAAQQLGLESVPTVTLASLTAAQKRAYVIADNKLAENAGWDTALLKLEFQYLADLEIEFDLTLTGFATPEIDGLLFLPDAEDDADEAVPALAAGPAITQPGDLWQIGPHRLICADATQAATYPQLLGTAPADLVFTDPPYNVPIQGHVSGLGQHAHREFAMGVGELSAAEFAAFLQTVCGHLAAHSRDGALHYICMDWRHIAELQAAGTATYTELKNLCVWVKSNGGMGSLYRSRHELVFVFKHGTAPHINNVELGRHGRYRTNVWEYAGMSSFGKERDAALAAHPTVKPVALVADAILDASNLNAIVLDAFAGSGTTLLAAAQTGRRGYGIELDPHYCDVILRRLSAAGFQPVHAITGAPFVPETPAAADGPSEQPHGHG